MKKWSAWILPLLFSVVIIVLAFPAIRELFFPNYYTSHDGEGHVIRMDEFYRAFLDGNIPVRWSERLYFGYGYPFFNFNYPSVYYAGVPVMLAGFSATAAMKTETIVTFLLSGIFMYFYLRRKVSDPVALMGAVLYLYAPYRLLNIYVRGSVAESAAFLFPPLLLWSAEALAINRKRAIPVAALVLGALGISHNISALLLFGMFFTYSLILSLQRKSLWPFLRSCIAFGFGLMLAAFFFIPALTEKKYTFLDQTIAKDYPDHFVYIQQLEKGGWGYGGSVAGPDDGLSFNMGWVQSGLSVLTLCIATGALILKRKSVLVQKYVWPIIFSVVILFGAIFFMIEPSKIFWDHLPLLPFVQFPWRFLMLTVPALTVLSALGVEAITRNGNVSSTSRAQGMQVTQMVKRWAIVIGVIAVTIYVAQDKWHINQELVTRTFVGDAIEGSTTWADEQATHWFIPKPSTIPVNKVDVPTSNALVNILLWKTNEHEYAVETNEATQSATIVENTMYYPGWKVWIDGQETTVNYQDKDHPGLLVFAVPGGNHTVISRFTETPFRLAMDLLSFTTFIGIIIYIYWTYRPALLSSMATSSIPSASAPGRKNKKVKRQR